MRLRSVCVLVFIIIIFIPVVSSAGPVGPYTGQVIDSQTGDPIKGASVLIYWDRGMPSPGGEVTDFIKAKLVYTDNKGKYNIPLTMLNTGLLGYLASTDVIIYEPGYQAYIVTIYRGSDKKFKRINNIVKLERIPPHFNHKEHDKRIESASRGMDDDIILYQEFIRRADWEERR